jgi:imidazolonepropionase-like amidohydrolase
VWTGTEFEPRDLTMRDGKFTAQAANGETAIDAGWLWLTPPLADAHTHTVDRSRSLDDSFHAAQMQAGVFYAFNANSLMPLARKPMLRGPRLVDVVFAGAGITSPGGHPRPLYERLANNHQLGDVKASELPGLAFHEASDETAAKAAVQRVKRSGVSFVKLYLSHHDEEQSNGLNAQAFRAAVAEARRVKLRVVVHINGASDFRLAIGERVHALMHMPASVLGETRSDADYLLTPSDASAAHAAGTIVVPTVAPAFYFTSGKFFGSAAADHGSESRAAA